jgi:hypothetical protein
MIITLPPPHATEALLRVEKFEGTIWEPACGEGAMSKVLQAHGYDVISTDLVNRGYGQYPIDFLMEYKKTAQNIVTNPPFKLAIPFVEKSLSLTTGKVAMLLKLTFLETQKRRKLFDSTPIARVYIFSERVTMQRGRQTTVDDTGGMIAYAWYVWEHGYTGKPTLDWI